MVYPDGKDSHDHHPLLLISHGRSSLLIKISCLFSFRWKIRFPFSGIQLLHSNSGFHYSFFAVSIWLNIPTENYLGKKGKK